MLFPSIPSVQQLRPVNLHRMNKPFPPADWTPIYPPILTSLGTVHRKNSQLFNLTVEIVLPLLNLEACESGPGIPEEVYTHPPPPPCPAKANSSGLLECTCALARSLVCPVALFAWLLANMDAVPVDITFCFISTGKSASCTLKSTA